MAAADVEAGEGRIYRLFASGDTMLSGDMSSLVYQHGPRWPVQQIRELIKGADIALTNLECVIATQGEFWDKREEKPYYYRAPPLVLDVLTEAGFDLVTTANNHAMDFGPVALLEELDLLEQAGIAAVGSGRNHAEAAQATYIRAGDVTIAFFGLTTYNAPVAALQKRPGVLWLEGNDRILNMLGPAIEEARRHADLVVFSPHWGGNWTERPSRSRTELAHALIDLGVDAIMGHSAHQLHGIEVYKGRPIVYDMGNFLWDLKTFKKRGQLTAGFVFEFNRSGFTRLLVHPLQLQYGHTVRAEGDVLRKTQDMMIRLSRELNDRIEFSREGDALVLNLQPPSRAASAITPPPRLHHAGSTRALPDELRYKHSNVVYDSMPAWVNGNQNQTLSHGVEFLGARMVEAAHRDSGFVAEIAIKVSGPMDSAWRAEIKGIERRGADHFVVQYPVAHGNWPPESWQANQIGADLVFVRPPTLKGGTYDLSWRLVNAETGASTRPLNNANDLDGYVPIGEVWFGSLGLSHFGAGVSWSGRLDALQSVFKHLNLTRSHLMLLASGSVLGLGVISLLILLRLRRAST